MTRKMKPFPNDFKWGVATSAYQIEGYTKEDGRSACIWDTFSRRPGRIKNGHTADVACEHYKRYQEDFAILQSLGIKNYRMSLPWSRIFPQGNGPVNRTALEYYDRVIESLLLRGIEPNVTLYHWDLPVGLEAKRGWLNRDTAMYFAEYADTVVSYFGDRVKHWSTINEPWVIANLGYSTGEMAPGYKDEVKAVKVGHHLLLAHGLALNAIRQRSSDAQVGIVQIVIPTYPSSSSEADIKAADLSWNNNSKWFIEPIFKGAYPSDDRFRLDCLDSVAKQSDFVYIKEPIDFLGVNYYFRHVVSEHGVVRLFQNSNLTGMNWEIFPQGLYDLLIKLNNEYNLPPVYITENGAAFEDVLKEDGKIYDKERTKFIADHISSLQNAISDGVDVRGYYCWSLLDNFEWAYGYTQRFGLVHVDYKTQKRTLKESAHFYKKVIENNGLEEPEQSNAALIRQPVGTSVSTV